MERHTARLIEDMTDEGLFERLATAVLRLANPDRYGHLTHPGVNSDGRTVVGPLDAVAMRGAAGRTILVISEYTTTRARGLRRKWLNTDDPEGDLHKALRTVEEERSRTHKLGAFIALCCSVEPPEDLTRDAAALAVSRGVELDLWTRERIADFLDYNADGQYLRLIHFGRPVERLSARLLTEISRLEASRIPNNVSSEVLIERSVSGITLDDVLDPFTFIVGESGCGKSLCAHRLLALHIERSGYGLVVHDSAVQPGVSIERVVTLALQSKNPSLADSSGAEALALCSANNPLLLIVEDINTVGSPNRAIESILGWIGQENDALDTERSWKMICPVWPQTLSGLRDDRRRLVEKFSVHLGGLDKTEGRELILRRARQAEMDLSSLVAENLADSLGNDPLLIALCGIDESQPAHEVIQHFIAGSCRRLASIYGTRIEDDYSDALRLLCVEMLKHRTLAPGWREVTAWFKDDSEVLVALRELVSATDIVRVSDSVLRFRHDRVRLTLLSNAIAKGIEDRTLPRDVIADPGYADAVGHAIAGNVVSPDAARTVVSVTPLAGFIAVKVFGTASSFVHKAVVDALLDWLSGEAVSDEGLTSLRWEALRVLAQTDSPHALEFLERFKDKGWAAIEARFRHGDLDAGIALCGRIGPGSRAPWRDSLIGHVWQNHRHRLEPALCERLSVASSVGRERIGELNLVGFARANACLASIVEGWALDTRRTEHLSAYLWAASQCHGDDVETLLTDLCAAWAQLPEEAASEAKRDAARVAPLRHAVVLNDLQWGVARGLTDVSLRFFLALASDTALSGPIRLLLEHVDHPDVFALLVSLRVAAIQRARVEGLKLLPLGRASVDFKRKRRKYLSAQSSVFLHSLWADANADEETRKVAFEFWATRVSDSEIRNHCTSDDSFLADEMLRARLDRGDGTASALLVGRVRQFQSAYWWQYARHVWCKELTDALEDALDMSVAACDMDIDRNSDTAWILAELIIRRPSHEIEALLVPRWKSLCSNGLFVQAALFGSTAELRRLVAETVRAAAEPRELFQYISMHWGIHVADHPGVTSVEQMETLVPYLDFLHEPEIFDFWQHCNDRRWFDFRRKHLDSRLTEQREFVILSVEQLHAKLDQELRTEKRFPMDHWLNRCLHVGWEKRELLDAVDAWLLTANSSATALSIAAEIVRLFGSRDDAERLVHFAAHSARHEAIVRDLWFAVARRVLQ